MTPSAVSAARASGTSAASTSPPAAQRAVSVLFCDLVGFTPLSESRDPEEVRELLASRAEGAAARPWIAQAREILERLRAGPWLERLDRLTSPESVSA